MATTTEAGTKTSAHQSIHIYEKNVSSSIVLGDSLVLQNPISEGMSHVFIGVQMFDSGGLLIVDAAGTFTVTVKTINTEQFEAVDGGGVIDATAPTTVSVGANISEIKVVPAALSTTVTYKVIVTGNGA